MSTRSVVVAFGFTVMACLVFTSLSAKPQAPVAQPSPSPSRTGPGAAKTPDKTPPLGAMKISDRFAGPVTIRTKDNRAQQVAVTITDWIVHDHQKVERFPEDGLLVFHLRAGEITTIINGHRQERREDDFWTVPPGTTIGFETDRDTASMQVWAVKNP